MNSFMPKRKFQIDQLIINSPYEEPSMYWNYDRGSESLKIVEIDR